MFTLSSQTFPQSHIPKGNVKGKWVKQHSPYYVDGEIRIPYGKKLVVEPGVHIIFTGHYKLIVNGILEAKGSENDSIYFFPSDTAVGWHGIRFLEAEDYSNLEYCVLKYGKTATADSMDITRYNETCDANPDCDELNLCGGAILVYNSSPVITHSTISENAATWAGGGIAVVHHSSPEISHSTIENNTLLGIGDGCGGGGISVDNYSTPKMLYCQIRNNTAFGAGGGIYCSRHANPLIKNCSVSGNRSTGLGGGMAFRDYCSPQIDTCVIENNSTTARGGGICFYTNAKPVVRHSTISGNTAPLGGGIYIDEFYNVYREQPGKIDISIADVRIDNNTAEYGGGVWIRDTMGKLSGVTICNNRAMIGGGVHIEHNPVGLQFSSEHPCNVYMNFARTMGNDFFRLGGELYMVIPLDTFTVKHYSALNAEPVEKFVLGINNFKLVQVNADLYVNPDGDDANSGLSRSDPLRSLRIAFLKLLADSASPRTVYMDEGEYVFSETNDALMLAKQKYVSLKGIGFTEVIFGTDRITVFAPWWITGWAVITYATVLLSVILIAWNVRMRRVRIKNELERERFEAHKLHELEAIRIRFFTNVSHEFRTPLTLILGPAKRLLERLTDDKAKEELDLIHRSAKKLNRLVDELLDISKIEAGEMKLQARPINLVALVNESLLPFQPLAETKHIGLDMHCDENEIVVYLDKNKTDKILTNVLSNAFKFTPEGGKVGVGINRKDHIAEIVIADTGIGIPKDRIGKIFDRFYQVDGSQTREHEGTGIGLSLTRELTELQKGRIEVKSEEGRGSTFTLIFPLGKDHLTPEEIEEAERENNDQERESVARDSGEGVERRNGQHIDIEVSEKSELPSLLVVEDNPDVRKYIRMILEHGYRIAEAKDGEEGLHKSIEGSPDLVISDIMMPRLDGFQLCSKLKTDGRTSHIPVILLTAKATMEDKLNGLEIGADDYIMKPFDASELKARIDNLLEQRKRLREYFRKYGLCEMEGKNITSVDQKFLQTVATVINEHISDTTFGVEALADNVAVSRSLLFKKIHSLIGEPPNELIKRTRLSKAAKLIENNAGNISEIALEVGFSNPSYFAECFRKQFGIPPSHYRHRSGGT